MKILCLFVRYGTEHHPDGLAQLDAWYAGHGLLEQRLLWIIDNRLPSGTPPTQIGPATVLRAGDNRAWEFSGWESALEDARAVPGIDVVHFVTSAFNTLYAGYLNHFRPEMIPFVAARPVCLGHIDSYETPIEILRRTSSSWIRSCFFFLQRELALHPRTWATFSDRQSIFVGDTSPAFRPDAPLSSDYQRRIAHWLTGQEQGGHRWHSPIAAGRADVARFQAKAMAIINEHHLSIQLRDQAVQLADFCWLWHASSVQSAPCPLSLPSEAEQLRFRRRILNIPE